MSFCGHATATEQEHASTPSQIQHNTLHASEVVSEQQALRYQRPNDPLHICPKICACVSPLVHRASARRGRKASEKKWEREVPIYRELCAMPPKNQVRPRVHRGSARKLYKKMRRKGLAMGVEILSCCHIRGSPDPSLIRGLQFCRFLNTSLQRHRARKPRPRRLQRSIDFTSTERSFPAERKLLSTNLHPPESDGCR